MTSFPRQGRDRYRPWTTGRWRRPGFCQDAPLRPGVRRPSSERPAMKQVRTHNWDRSGVGHLLTKSKKSGCGRACRIMASPSPSAARWHMASSLARQHFLSSCCRRRSRGSPCPPQGRYTEAVAQEVTARSSRHAAGAAGVRVHGFAAQFFTEHYARRCRVAAVRRSRRCASIAEPSGAVEPPDAAAFTGDFDRAVVMTSGVAAFSRLPMRRACALKTDFDRPGRVSSPP